MKMRHAVVCVLVMLAPGLAAEASTLRGRVTSFTSERGLAGATVTVYPAAGQQDELASTLTGLDGTYSIDGLPDGLDLRVRYALEGWDKYPTWEPCRLPERSRIDLALMESRPTPDDVRGLFERLGSSSQAELETAWKKLGEYELDGDAQALVRSQAVSVLGEDVVQRVEKETSVSFEPGWNHGAEGTTVFVQGGEEVHVAYDPADAAKPKADSLDTPPVEIDDSSDVRAQADGGGG